MRRRLRRHLSLLVLSFALLVDHPADRSGADRNTLLPDTWLGDHADLGIPALRRAAALPLPTPDERFDQVASAVTTRIRRELADAGMPGPRDGAEGGSGESPGQRFRGGRRPAVTPPPDRAGPCG
ncbi:hypothetical protein GCM10010433_23030 [Streptomyces pulveraceus]|uniref:Uncharacterized protein n=1 Tax=Streptomyces pulveraceus TaxID=68258 RepID=A0ABW1GHJ2_9ACTN